MAVLGLGRSHSSVVSDGVDRIESTGSAGSVASFTSNDARRLSELPSQQFKPVPHPIILDRPLVDTTDRLLSSDSMPFLREVSYCEAIAGRSKFQDHPQDSPPPGPPDLVHRGKLCSTRSAEYMNNDFLSNSDKKSSLESDGGYVGNYHYVNGMDFDHFEQSVEQYMYKVAGIISHGVDYFFQSDWSASNVANTGKREMVVSYCTYNIFNRLDFRVKMIITLESSLRRAPVKIDKQYLIIPNRAPDQRSRKTFNYSTRTIQNISPLFWEELKVSQIVRTFLHLDAPLLQIPGLVTLPHYVQDKRFLIQSISLVAKHLARGFMCGTAASFGNATSSGLKTDENGLTLVYRNHLILALLRLCQLDISGECSNFAITAIKDLYYEGKETGPWDYVILKILKAQNGSNNEQKFLELINHHLANHDLYSTQLALLLLQQARFLITKGAFVQAKVVAQKCVTILPLDFECWETLTLCNVLLEDYSEALLVFNTIPILSHDIKPRSEEYKVNGVDDKFTATFIERMNSINEEVISEQTFESYFPQPLVCDSNPRGNVSLRPKRLKERPLGSIAKIWGDEFLYSPHLRHPICGNFFTQSPLMNCSALELSLVDANMIRLCGPSSTKSLLASQSAGTCTSSLLDFSRTSTWGRCYDLLSFMIARAGWETIARTKEQAFKKPRKDTANGDFVIDKAIRQESCVACEEWVERIFMVIYEDLRTMVSVTTEKKDTRRSALEWEMTGLLGWASKYSLKESMSSLVTSVVGNASEGKFDYFGVVACLEIYDEFILGASQDSQIDLYHDDYNLAFKSNKLIVELSGVLSEGFTNGLESKYLNLDFVLLNLLKLISWNVRWYQYVPNYLVFRLLNKLIIRFDHMYILAQMRIVFERHKKASKSPTTKSFMKNIWNTSSASADEKHEFKFAENDTILEYVKSLILWMEGAKSRVGLI